MAEQEVSGNEGEVSQPTGPATNVPAEGDQPTMTGAGEGESQEQEASQGEGEATSKPAGKDRLNKRFSELTRTIHETRDAEARERARAEAAERRLAELERGRLPTEPGGEDKAPKLEDFKEYEDYAEARARWVTRQELRKASAVAREHAQREAALNRAAEVRGRWETAETKARDVYEDYDEVMAASPVRFPESLAVALLDSDKGPELSYYLKKHPEEITPLRGLTLLATARALGRMELKLASAPPEKPQSSAPKPPTPTRPSAPAEELTDKLSDTEWIRRRNKQELDRRRNGN